MSASSARPLLPVFLTVAGLGLAGCAGGGGGGMMVVSPPPLPPTTFVSVSGQNSYIINTGGVGPSGIFASTSNSPNVTVTITDQEGAASLGAVQFDGHQSVQLQDGSGGITENLQSGNYVGNTPTRDPRVGVSATARTVALSSWEASVSPGDGTANNHLYGFYTFGLRKGPGGTTPSYVALTEAQISLPGTFSNYQTSFQLMGVPTTAVDMPHTGSATFTGESFGQFIPTSGASTLFGTAFLGAATLNVDFSKTTGAITGVVDNTAQTSAADALRFRMTFTADISGSKFSGTTTAANAATGTALPTPMTGNVQGAFYGPTAAAATEAGGTFSANGPFNVNSTSAGLIGGFVAGR